MDPEQFNEAYFTRLHDRVRAAQNHGLYPSVMLFEGWGLPFSPNAWENHPFHPANNINGVNGDLNGDGMGVEIHTGRSPRITELQRAYVRKVIDTVNSFDNVLYEISNENYPPSTGWQYPMIRFIKEYEKSLPKQHPVGMTFQYKGGSNKTLFDSPADWISPNPEGGYRDDPPAADGRKVVVSDTDHLWGIGGSATWVWKSFLRGLNPIFMDPYDGAVLSHGFDDKQCNPIREAMGQVLDWSRRVDLAAMTPRGELASSKYCLANPGVEYLVYQPQDKAIVLQLPAGTWQIEWFDPSKGAVVQTKQATFGEGKQDFRAPFTGPAVLFVRSSR